MQATYPTILVDMITRHTRAMSLLTLESYLKFLYKYVSYSSLQESKRDGLIFIPMCRGHEPINKMKSNHGRNPINKHNEDTRFSLKVHVLAGTLRPRCVDQHLVVRWLRGVARTLSSLGHHKNLPTSEVTQWHEQSTRVTFRLSTGEGTRPLTITGRWPRTITNSCQSSSAAPNRLGGGNHQE